MKNKVLILSVSRKVSLVRAFQEAGWYVIGQDKDPNAVALKFCDDVAPEDRGIGIDLIVPTRDAELLYGTHRASNETIEICTDKFKFSKWCEENGFRAPKCYFVKPRVSSSGKEVETVWQELVEGEEYSVDLFSDLEGAVIGVVPRRRIKVFSGESVVSQTVLNQTLIDESIRLSTSLKLIGHNCIQCFITKENQIIWTDVNPRFGGASIIALKAGLLSPLWLLKLINKEEVKPQIGNYEVGLIGRSYSEWTFDGV